MGNFVTVILVFFGLFSLIGLLLELRSRGILLLGVLGCLLRLTNGFVGPKGFACGN